MRYAILSVIMLAASWAEADEPQALSRDQKTENQQEVALAEHQEAAIAEEAELNRQVRDLLQKGKADKALPANVVVRLEADLGMRSGKGAELQEAWEFTSTQVHRVSVEPSKTEAGKVVYRRVESRPFGSQNLCRDLLAGKLMVIAAEEGMGESQHFCGTKFDAGHRGIEIFIDNRSMLRLGESCFFAGYAKSDAEAFATLYENLAKQARAIFTPRKAKIDQ